MSLSELLSGDKDDQLRDQAISLRRQYWGKAVFLRGIVEFSNYCRQNCLYCGLRRENSRLVRYRLSPETILLQVRLIAELGFGTVVLQSGEDPQLDAAAFADLIRRITQETGLAVTLSLGQRTPAEYALWRDAGATRYLLKMETFDPGAHAALRPGNSLEERLSAYHNLAELGYETGSGLIAGLPGETPERLARDFEALVSQKPDMLSISPFIPHPDTPLAGHPPFGSEEALRLMAIARLLVPTAHIPVTSALSLYGEALRAKALLVGNVLMPSLTPESVRAQYSIYPGKNRTPLTPFARAKALRGEILAQGFELPPGPGAAWRLGKR